MLEELFLFKRVIPEIKWRESTLRLRYHQYHHDQQHSCTRTGCSPVIIRKSEDSCENEKVYSNGKQWSPQIEHFEGPEGDHSVE